MTNSKSTPPPPKIIQLYNVAPAADSPESAAECSLPLTYLDTAWFRFPPVELLFFYKPTSTILTPVFFHSVLLPKLIHSLSKTLAGFLPLAGHLRWPPDSPTPTVVYTPGDAVSVIIAESDAECFDRLAGDEPRQAGDSRAYVPELELSDTAASVISLQITYFVGKGFSVGLILHHAVLDAKSVSMFLRAWSLICKNGDGYRLLEELTPSLDRTVVKDPLDLASAYLNKWLAITTSARRLNVFQILATPPPDLLRATFNLSPDSIEKLRHQIVSYRSEKWKRIDHHHHHHHHLSLFVVTCAFVSVCLVKARGGGRDRPVYLVLTVDCRSRLLESVPGNYLGNCLAMDYFVEDAGRFMEEDGIAAAAERISDLVAAATVAKVDSEDAVEKMGRLRRVGPEVQKIGVAGSHKLGFYDVDFGMGKPVKMETTSLETTRGISLTESRDGKGGMEVGVVLVREEMDAFTSFFRDGLRYCGCSRM
ncbi:Phenolic glucoside malonyltransferase 2 [Linum grandiflorum]